MKKDERITNEGWLRWLAMIAKCEWWTRLYDARNEICNTCDQLEGAFSLLQQEAFV